MSETTTPPKAQRGCLFYGCIAGGVCLLAVLVTFLLLLRMANKALNQFTDTRPTPLPALHLSQPEIEETQRRFNIFRDAASAGRPTPALELTSDDINALLNNTPEFQEAKNKIYIKMENGQLQAQVSVPMSDLGLSVFKGRYLNGTGTFSVSLQNGQLTITPVEILVKGKPLPKPYMDKMRQQNLAMGINNNPRTSVAMNRLQDVQIRDGKLVLVPKQEK
jgi:hypothetical protein